MNLDDSIAAMRYLSAMTGGWDDTVTATYAAELANLDDGAALMVAVRRLAASWTDSWRPSLGVVVEAYNAELAAIRREAERHAPPALDPSAVAIDRGRVLAWEAYVAECASRTPPVEPSQSAFGRWAARIGAAREA